MHEFFTVARQGDIPAGEGRAFAVQGRMIAVFHTAVGFTAIDDTCPHMGASLATGDVAGTEVTCPWHAWRFCVATGAWLDNPRSKIAQKRYAVRVAGDEIQVALVPPEPAA